MMLEITSTVHLPESELEFSASRSSGPGGQHVNKTSTKVDVVLDIDGSPYFTTAQKELIRRRLGSRISGDGRLRVSAAEHRSQTMNRRAAVERLTGLLHMALIRQKPRKPTKTPARAHDKRLTAKKMRAEVKRRRGKVDW